jgi:hypothetical protein
MSFALSDPPWQDDLDCHDEKNGKNEAPDTV